MQLTKQVFQQINMQQSPNDYVKLLTPVAYAVSLYETVRCPSCQLTAAMACSRFAGHWQQMSIDAQELGLRPASMLWSEEDRRRLVYRMH